MLGGRRFVLLRIWAGRRFRIHQIMFGWGWSWLSWFVWDWRDAVGGWFWSWGDIRWFVRHWGHRQLFTCVVNVFMTLFVVCHLKINESIEHNFQQPKKSHLIHKYIFSLTPGKRRMSKLGSEEKIRMRIMFPGRICTAWLSTDTPGPCQL